MRLHLEKSYDIAVQLAQRAQTTELTPRFLDTLKHSVKLAIDNACMSKRVVFKWSARTCGSMIPIPRVGLGADSPYVVVEIIVLFVNVLSQVGLLSNSICLQWNHRNY